jgi:hypothetical protein
MNNDSRARRRRFVPSAATTSALLAALTLLAACGSPPGSKPAPATGQEQALKYARCMRGNGVPGFPDPDPGGRFRGVGHEQQNNPAFRAAQQACRALAPGGEHEKPGDPAFVEQMRKFSQCMRNNGLPGFPDPDASGQLRGAGHEQQDNPKYRAAFEACRAKLPGGGAHQ